ncbi:MAG TPA: hypothetical protein VF746_29475 [Longimicrobium sp.]|jgi:hypothetical protein
MRKLKLEIDALRVESFAPVAEDDSRGGTVHGHSYPNGCFPPSDSQDPYLDTCGYATCAGNSCWQSCNGYTCGGCDPGGSAGCFPESAGYTYCLKDASCINQCLPTGNQDTCPGVGNC